MTRMVFDIAEEISSEKHLALEEERATNAEASFLKVLMVDNSLYPSHPINRHWFANVRFRKVYETIGYLIKEGRTAEPTTVADILESQEPNTRWLELVVDIFRNLIAYPESVDTYLEIIQEAHTKRNARAIARRLLSDIHKGREAVDTATSSLMELYTDSTKHDFDSKAVIKAAIERTEEAFEKSQNGQIVGITTGLIDLDNATGGWHDTDLVVIPARPAMGKTALLLNLALNSGVRFGVISSEQAHDQMGVRMLSIEGHVSGSKIRRGKLLSDDWGKLSNGAHGLANREFWINDDPTITIDGIRRQARKWAYTNEIKILFVDYIQRIYPTDAKQPKHQQIEEITRGLKSLAKELHIPVIALAQVNRECERRPDKRPGMGDIADASIIEKEADVIATLYRDEVYTPDSPHKGVAEIGICKNRHGPTGKILAKWDGSTFRFENLHLNRENQQ
ncbi:Replicative DNA helicase [Marinobacterium lacunae]|uniref:DNA 5'-3' helicase n=1 Tax=Marinobacterium lacunae TaxID=1232683 RepID=A0A081FX70_9GAMM|nr:DnaB-like helicase C-terminal domain-containing protein [Marinobacterium lacunae]KEA63125.1 Replicative DNA helicase [Marinobacterium lacunae]